MDRQEAGSYSPDLTGGERAALSQLKESLQKRFGDRLLKWNWSVAASFWRPPDFWPSMPNQ